MTAPHTAQPDSDGDFALYVRAMSGDKEAIAIRAQNEADRLARIRSANRLALLARAYARQQGLRL